MSKVVASAQTAAPPEKIWALMCSPHRYSEFVDATDRMVEVPDGEVGVGYTYKEYGGVPPFKSESSWRVTEFVENRRQVHVGDDGSMTLNVTIDIAPSEGGCRLDLGLELRPRWFLAPVAALMWPLMMHRRAQASMDVTVANVKRIVESD